MKTAMTKTALIKDFCKESWESSNELEIIGNIRPKGENPIKLIYSNQSFLYYGIRYKDDYFIDYLYNDDLSMLLKQIANNLI